MDVLLVDLYILRDACQQAPRVDRPPPTLSYATQVFLPATQGQRSKDREEKAVISW